MRRHLFLVPMLLGASFAFAGDKVSFKKEREIPLSGGGSFDYLTADGAGKRLYIAHAPKIDVLDLESGKLLGSVDGVDGAHGTVVVASEKRGFATAGRKNKLIVFDLETFKVTKEIDTGEKPDACIWCETTKEVWVMNGKGNITCVDPKSLEVKATVKLEGKLEAAAEWVAKGLVFVNVEDKNVVAQIDAKKHEVTGTRISLAPGEAPSGLAIDQETGTLFSACSDSKKMACIDAAAGKVVQMCDIGDHCDGAAFDPETKTAFASCGDGTTTMIHEDGGGKFSVAGSFETAAGGRTCSFDPITHRYCVGAGTRGKSDVKVLIFVRDSK